MSADILAGLTRPDWGAIHKVVVPKTYVEEVVKRTCPSPDWPVLETEEEKEGCRVGLADLLDELSEEGPQEKSVVQGRGRRAIST